MNKTGATPALPAYPHAYQIKTQRLELRALADSDAKNLWPMVSDSRLTTFLAWEPHRSIEETESMILSLTDAQRSGLGFHWAVIHDDLVVGLVSLIDMRSAHRTWTLSRAELAYWIGPSYQGHGYATEAAAAVVEFGFSDLQLHKIRVYHAADNPASGRTVKKLGFRLVGEEEEAFRKDGVWHHLRHFERLASDSRHTTIPSTRSLE